MEPTPQSQPQMDWMSNDALTVAFQEYQFLSEGTDKITDRRQTVNTLFVSINALFLTGVGYLLFQFFETHGRSRSFLIGFLVIAVITTLINRAWLKLSESNRRLVDLRIRYLKQIEAHLRDSAVFPSVTVLLKDDEISKDGPDKATTRGTYTLEDVLYNNPGVAKEQFSFSRAEQQIGRTFTSSYWLAFVLAAIAYLVVVILPLYIQSFPHL
jgi:hypothetical protein